MNMLVSGVHGMVGEALYNNLKNLRDNKNHTRSNIKIDEIYEYDINNTPADLDLFCPGADFVINCVGVNCPTNP